MLHKKANMLDEYRDLILVATINRCFRIFIDNAILSLIDSGPLNKIIRLPRLICLVFFFYFFQQVQSFCLVTLSILYSCII